MMMQVSLRLPEARTEGSPGHDEGEKALLQVGQDLLLHLYLSLDLGLIN